MKWMFGLCFVFVSLLSYEHEKPLVIVTASYNNREWFERNLSSIFIQKYDNWRLIYIDDCSQDGTADLVETFVKLHKQEHRVTLIKNAQRRKHLANQYDAIHSCKPHEIVLIIDGDDWLAHDQVFSYINTVYSTQDVWLTYGQFWYWKKDRKGICKKLPQNIILEGKFRDQRPWMLSHLRTFYAGLFQAIKYEDLLYGDSFYHMCADVATMMPMAEMAGTHVLFIPDILYVYNDANSLCFYHDHVDEQRSLEQEIRSKKRYLPLINPPYYQSMRTENV